MMEKVTEVIEEVKDEICNSICKYSDDQGLSYDDLMKLHCEECPLNKL